MTRPLGHPQGRENRRASRRTIWAGELLLSGEGETWIDATSEIQHLVTRRLELTKHGAVDPTTVRTYLGQLAHLVLQFGPLREQLQQRFDDLGQFIESDAVQQQDTP